MATSHEDHQDFVALKRALVALKDMRAKLGAMERTQNEPVAIIGMGCRFPGGQIRQKHFGNYCALVWTA